jgi:ferric-dicitrate binding protein FerR (iron transport regulator)
MQELNDAEKAEWFDALRGEMYDNDINDLAQGVFERNDLLKYKMEETKATDVLNYILVQPQRNRPKTISIRKFIAVAAAVVLVIGIGLFYYHPKVNQDQPRVAVYKNDVAPGKQGATLTLASGKKIRLTDAANGKLAEEAGVVISKSANGQLVYEIKDTDAGANKINILSTARGETYQIRLPDGSVVFLNAASSLKYPASFVKLANREVKLTGEGYFEVAKDKNRPFIVESGSQKVKVLGTHFNISAYYGEHIKTTLLEGSVRIAPIMAIDRSGASRQISHDVVLKPNQQSSFMEGSGISVKDVDALESVAWTSNKFSFASEEIGEIMKKIERWYDVEIVYDDDVRRIKVTGSVSRFANLSALLSKLQKTGLVNFKVEGRKVFVSK